MGDHPAIETKGPVAGYHAAPGLLMIRPRLRRRLEAEGALDARDGVLHARLRCKE
jgi:hypothetical protein